MASNEYLNNRTFETLIVKFQEAKKESNKYLLLIEDIKNTEKRTLTRGKYKKPSAWIIDEKEYNTANFQYQYRGLLRLLCHY